MRFLTRLSGSRPHRKGSTQPGSASGPSVGGADEGGPGTPTPHLCAGSRGKPALRLGLRLGVYVQKLSAE